MVVVCLPSDALLQHLPSYLGFSYLGHGVSLHGCSSKAQPLPLTLEEGYLLMAAPPDRDMLILYSLESQFSEKDGEGAPGSARVHLPRDSHTTRPSLNLNHLQCSPLNL